jgi:16S rRNA (uracil1498-N3)-methyltransferase
VSSKVRVPFSPLARGEAVLDEASSRYVARVHRLGVGAALVLFDPVARTEADARISDLGGRAGTVRGVRCSVGDVRSAATLPTREVILVQGIGKGDKPEQVVRDATALGASKIVFAECARSVVVVGDRGAAKRRRWEAVAAQAARQSGRGDVPVIDGPMPLREALDSVSTALHRVCLAPQGPTPLGRALAHRPPEAALAILVGPEGGLEDAELECAREAGFLLVSFGALVLRTETAAIAVLGAVLAMATATATATATELAPAGHA